MRALRVEVDVRLRIAVHAHMWYICIYVPSVHNPHMWYICIYVPYIHNPPHVLHVYICAICS